MNSDFGHPENTDPPLVVNIAIVPNTPTADTRRAQTPTGVKYRYYAKRLALQSNQVKRTPQEPINEFIIQKLNPLLVVDFRLISAFLYA